MYEYHQEQSRQIKKELEEYRKNTKEDSTDYNEGYIDGLKQLIYELESFV